MLTGGYCRIKFWLSNHLGRKHDKDPTQAKVTSGRAADDSANPQQGLPTADDRATDPLS